MPRQLGGGLCHPNDSLWTATTPSPAKRTQHSTACLQKALKPSTGHWAAAAWAGMPNKHPEIHHNTPQSSQILAPRYYSTCCVLCPRSPCPLNHAMVAGFKGVGNRVQHTRTDQRDHCNPRGFQNHYQRTGSTAQRPSRIDMAPRGPAALPVLPTHTNCTTSTEWRLKNTHTSCTPHQHTPRPSDPDGN
jgi:hypothetical protein